MARNDGCTDLEVSDGSDGSAPVWVCVEAIADPRSARQTLATLRHCVSVELHERAHGCTAVVHGVGHRRPVDVRVSLPTALGLIELGVPAIVR